MKAQLLRKRNASAFGYYPVSNENESRRRVLRIWQMPDSAPMAVSSGENLDRPLQYGRVLVHAN